MPMYPDLQDNKTTDSKMQLIIRSISFISVGHQQTFPHLWNLILPNVDIDSSAGFDCNYLTAVFRGCVR
jgi:hypothetical protein